MHQNSVTLDSAGAITRYFAKANLHTQQETLGEIVTEILGNDSNLLIVFYVQIMPDDFVMQLH
ncbi:hypothetical protein N4684_03680, partial [Escherichia coli]|nr:hypothetical protein [Escherichia coli]MCU6959674.1 hypothetical protein [Escherichia coli]NWP34287.1 hypothetical protein [Escherichia coli]NWP52525.1 hypothetical protein [Escherichia coli]